MRIFAGPVNGRDQLGTNTLQRQPVESVDNSVIIADQVSTFNLIICRGVVANL